jgi:hypothetical protein
VKVRDLRAEQDDNEAQRSSCHHQWVVAVAWETERARWDVARRSARTQRGHQEHRQQHHGVREMHDDHCRR